MDDKKAKELLKGISDLRFYGVYIDKQLASDFSIDLDGHIEHLEAENAKLKQENELLNECCHLSPEMAKSLTKDINKIKADAIKRMAIRICDDEFKADYDEIIEYADKVEKGEIE